MVLGFNHNIRYRGELFHVQTEDSGRANPHIITLLYRGGTILASAKTSYADIIKADQLEQVVESIMKEQHKEMMRRLKGGEFDARIFPGGSAAPADSSAAEPPAAASQPAAVPQAAATPAPPAPAATPAPVAPVVASEAAAPAANRAAATTQAATQAATAPTANPAHAAAAAPAASVPPAPQVKRSLDEVILDYLITGEEK